jgi:hypothetical protein
VSVGGMLSLGQVLRKKVKIKEEEIQIMKCAEGIKIEEGLKWLKKHKIRNEIRERMSLKENIKEDKETKNIVCGKVNK